VEAVLIREWMAGLTPTIAVEDEASVVLVRAAVREACDAAGFDVGAAGALAIVASELAHNQMAHARGGVVAVRGVERDGVAGVEVVAADEGEGIADPERALRDRESTSGSLGVGLGGAQRMSDEMDFDVRLGEGTCIRARKFAAPVRRRREVAILCRPCEGERVSGDHAVFARRPDALVLGVADGIGHGVLAREASARAIAVLRDKPDLAPEALLRACDLALAGSRGAVMTTVCVIEPGGATEHASVGNVTTRFVRRHASRALTGSAAVLGAPSPRPKRIDVSQAQVGDDEAIVLFTDGISSRADLAADADLLRAQPIVIAHHILSSFGKTSDDALVLVAR
jgi:anti-sigma regulatory factor (Ser/Thr protein kinase)